MQFGRVRLYTASGYYLSDEGNPHASENTFYLFFFMAYLNDPSQHSVMVFAIRGTIKISSTIPMHLVVP